MTRIQQWRHMATSFHRIAHQVAKGNLPADFEAGELAGFAAQSSNVTLSKALRDRQTSGQLN